jgi:hypothetical protein
MDVRVIHKVLSPGMQNADAPYFSPEMFRVLCEMGEGLGDGTEKEVVQKLAVHGEQGVEF